MHLLIQFIIVVIFTCCSSTVGGSQPLPIPIFARKPKKGECKNILSIEAYHFSVGSALGDGSIHKRDFCVEIEQRSASYTLWKRSKCLVYELLYHNPEKQHTQMFAFLQSNIPLGAKSVMKRRYETKRGVRENGVEKGSLFLLWNSMSL
jgi:hypothetical protein